jgi:hypothetical protein
MTLFRPSNVCVAVTASACKDNLLSENCAARDRRRHAHNLGHACPDSRSPGSGFVFRAVSNRRAKDIGFAPETALSFGVLPPLKRP